MSIRTYERMGERTESTGGTVEKRQRREGTGGTGGTGGTVEKKGQEAGGRREERGEREKGGYSTLQEYKYSHTCCHTTASTGYAFRNREL